MQKQGSDPPGKVDYERINVYIKEFLKFNKYQSTLECLEAEERTKLVTSKKKQMNVHPEVTSALSSSRIRNRRRTSPGSIGSSSPTRWFPAGKSDLKRT